MFAPTSAQSGVRDELVSTVAELFDVGWRELVAAGGGLEFEVEARLGVNEDHRFSPGVPQKFWDGLWGALRRSGAPMVATDHVDVAFEDRVRVTIDGMRANPPAPSITAVVRKTAEKSWKRTLPPIRASFLPKHSIRVSAARESEVAASTRKQYEQAALSAVGTTPLLPTLADGGTVRVKAGSITPPELAQLKWTAVRPSRMKRLRNRGALEMDRAPALLQLTNMPGVIVTASGEMRVCAMAQHVVDVAPGDLIDDGASNSDAADLEPVQLRRKKRFAFAVGEGMSLDLTQTQSAEDFADLMEAPRKFEVELERVFAAASATPPTTTEVLSFASLMLRHGFCLPRQFGTDVSATLRAKIAARFSALPSIDDQRAAAAHYSSLKRDAQSRTESWLYHLRCGNNWVKASLIRSALLRVKAERGLDHVSILDLACGKCADVGKFTRSASDAGMTISKYVGADIARGSLDDAVERLSSFDGGNFPATLACADLGSASMHAAPLEVWTSTTGWSERPLGSVRADLVSMQFALHYMFATRERASTFFADVSASMSEGAYFIATTVDASALVQHLLVRGEAIQSALDGDFPVRAAIADDRGRDVCVVTFDAKTVRALLKGGEDDACQFGLRYTFELHDDESGAAVAAPEWIVLEQHLRETASAHDMELVHYEPLPAFSCECCRSTAAPTPLACMFFAEWHDLTRRVGHHVTVLRCGV